MPPETATLADSYLSAEAFESKMSALGYLSVPIRAVVLGVGERTVQGYQEGRPIPRSTYKTITYLEEVQDLKRRVRYLEEKHGEARK